MANLERSAWNIRKEFTMGKCFALPIALAMLYIKLQAAIVEFIILKKYNLISISPTFVSIWDILIFHIKSTCTGRQG